MNHLGKWFHLTPRNLGNEVFLLPRGKSKEADLPGRICVCPSIGQCLLALPEQNYRNRLYIYSTLGSANFGSEFDGEITQEHWILHRKKFKFEGVINEALTYRDLVYGDNSGIENHFPELRLEYLKIKLKLIAQYYQQHQGIK